MSYVTGHASVIGVPDVGCSVGEKKEVAEAIWFLSGSPFAGTGRQIFWPICKSVNYFQVLEPPFFI